jgi:predicted dinucleotide-binding enzyme
MKVGILGTGDVAKALARGFTELGHEVRIGSRDASSEKALGLVQSLGARASAGSFADAAAFGETVVFATLGSADAEVVKGAGPERLRGKVVIDATNPLDSPGDLEPFGQPESAAP